jgi:hypothetical protein
MPRSAPSKPATTATAPAAQSAARADRGEQAGAQARTGQGEQAVFLESTTAGERTADRDANQQNRRVLTRLTAIERGDDFLNRVAAGIRGATISKLLFDEYETSIVLGVSPETLKVWRREGRGPPWVRLGDNKLVRYRFTELQDYAAGLKPEVAPPPAAEKK